jgi:1-acyl-sn-glycerol-3-phosphate acyltransferase
LTLPPSRTKVIKMFGNANLSHVADTPSTERSSEPRSIVSARWPFHSSPRPALALAVRGYLSAYHRLKIVGRDNLPKDEAFVMVSNHASHLDAVCLRAALPLHRLGESFTAVAEDYFCANPFRQAAARLLANAIPFSRHARSTGGLRRCRSLLGSAGTSLIYFPEGTRTRNGEMGRFRPGIGALLAGSRLQAVPCAVQGAFDAWPKGHRLARPGRVRVVIGQARRYETLAHGRQSYHLIADDLHSAVEALLCS